MTHGTAGCYRDGCRLPECTAAHRLNMNKYRARRARNGAQITVHGIVGGHLFVPAAPARKEIAQLRRKLTARQIASECGMSVAAVWDLSRKKMKKRMRPETAAAIHSLWVDYFGPVEKDRRIYPVAPLRDLVVRRFGSMKAAGSVRRSLATMAHTGLTAKQADDWSVRFDVLPEELWPDYGMPEEGQETG